MDFDLILKMLMNKRVKITTRNLSIFLILIFSAIFLHKNVLEWHEHKVLNEYAQKAEFPEIKGKKATFYLTIKTADSLTHIISYLPPSILSRENLDERAAFETISYVEQFAKKGEVFSFNPLVKNGLVLNLNMFPRSKNAENFVYLLSENDPVASIFKTRDKNDDLFEESIDYKKSFGKTVVHSNGSTSYIRIVDSETMRYGLPTADGQGINFLQQMNFVFNIELWKRSMRFALEDADKSVPDNTQTLLDASESLWNTFGQLTSAKQEKTPLLLMVQRLERGAINHVRNIAYYPYNEKAKLIYDNAPSDPIIR